MRKIIFFIILVLSLPVSAKAPLPEEQLQKSDYVWLARSMVAEAGWESERDHIAIAYVLARQWRMQQKRWPKLRFRDLMFRYVKGLGGHRREYTIRQRWIRSLSPAMTEPDHWPKRASWERHRPLWAATLVRVEQWAQGRLPDPCQGDAWHWGGTMDFPKQRMIKIDCGETKNTFYTLSSD